MKNVSNHRTMQARSYTKAKVAERALAISKDTRYALNIRAAAAKKVWSKNKQFEFLAARDNGLDKLRAWQQERDRAQSVTQPSEPSKMKAMSPAEARRRAKKSLVRARRKISTKLAQGVEVGRKDIAYLVESEARCAAARDARLRRRR